MFLIRQTDPGNNFILCAGNEISICVDSFDCKDGCKLQQVATNELTVNVSPYLSKAKQRFSNRKICSVLNVH